MKKIIPLFLALCCFNSSTFAATRSEQSQELKSLIEECERQGISVDYEKSAASVFDTFIPYEAEDSQNSSLSSSQKSYNTESMTKIYSDTKNKLNSYLDGSKNSLPSVLFAADGTRKISGNIFTNSAGEPLFSVGFGHFTDTFADADELKAIGSDNIQVEIGPNSTVSPSSIYMWKVLNNNGCDADTLIAEKDGGKVLRVNNRSSEADKYVLLSQIVPVEPGKRYKWSFDAVSEGSTRIKLFKDGFGSESNVLTTDAGTTKKTYTNIFTTSSDQYYINFMISVDYGSSVDIDNIELRNMRTNENAIKNGDFETAGNYYMHTDNLIPLINRINTAHEKGYSIDLLLSPHYVPDFMYNTYPDLKNNSPYGYSFNINQPQYRQMVQDHIEFVLSLAKNIDSVCLSNEPNYCSSGLYDYFNPLFREWMREKYSDSISSLNSAHGKSYSSFSEVNIPSYLKDTSGYPQADPMYYDYMLFNEEVFADWHKMLAQSVKTVRPDLPVHSKMQDYLFLYDGAAVAKTLFGTDAELFAEFCDIAGNDAATYVSQPRSRLGTMMWYDFLSSVTDKPVYNSEDHVITDYNSTFADETAQNVRYELLNGAVHGLCGSSLWTWQRPLDDITTLFKYFPYATYKAGQSMLDLKRVNNELAAFVTPDKDTAIFYSKASRIMNTSTYETALENDYAALNALGHKIGFVTERHPEKISGYKTLVLPDVQCLPEESAAEIANFIRAGGHVIIDGSNSLAYSEYKIPTSSADREYIKNNAYYLSGRTAASFNAAYSSFGESTSFVYENGSPASGIDLKKASYDGNNIIALTNVTDTNKTVTVNGKYINLYDLSEYDGKIALKPYEPMILKEKTDKPSVNVTTDIKKQSVDFNITYSYILSKNITISVAARDNNGTLAGMAYCQRVLDANKNSNFSGTINAADADTVEITVYDTDTKTVLYSETK